MSKINNKIDISKINLESIPFEIDKSKGLINITKIAIAFGRNVYDWKRLPDTQDLINDKLQEKEMRDFYVSQKGNNGQEQGTWVDKELALDFAQWIDMRFRRFCNKKLEELFTTGSTSIKPLSKLEMLQIQLNELIRVEQEQALMKEQINEHEDKINLHEDKLSIHDNRISKIEEEINIEEDFYSIKVYVKKHNIIIKKRSDYSQLGKNATKLSETMGYKKIERKDPMYEKIGLYHITVLQKVFEEYQNKVTKD